MFYLFLSAKANAISDIFTFNCCIKSPLNSSSSIVLSISAKIIVGLIFMFDFFKDVLPANSIIISPNAPFMIPVKKRGEYQMQFAWYFFDPAKKYYYMDYK